MNIEEAKMIIRLQERELNNGQRMNTQTVSAEYNYVFAKGFLEGVEYQKKKAEGLVEACRKLIDSIKWSGDINEVNVAPKIGPIRQALAEYEIE